MSTPRFKKDKEIIAEYESQVKGNGKSLQMHLSRNITSRGQANMGVRHNLSLCFRKLAKRGPQRGLQPGKQPHVCVEFQY